MPRDLEEFLRRAAQRRNQQGNRNSGTARSKNQMPVVKDSPRESSDKSQNRVGDHRLLNASSVDRADERMESHLHDHFDQGLGKLAQPESSMDSSTAGNPNEETPGMVSGIFAMLRDPQGVQHAILLNEILNRPTHRWD
ncbi:MAG: hypothetical protein VXY07_00795 [Planctomycetota bacterium]|nr:hypothetical protein [Planctomycetota bacterium]MEC8781336.1 hypothetical protein [Planctomycetota bacterium]MEE3032290.1 hypothetical protein [Planctomycetota bacterium]